ncbi:MAG: disulfide bond formation protein B [Thiomonas sp.]
MSPAPHSNRAAVVLSALAVFVTLGALGGALWLQQRGHPPCPLCILQRMAYLGVLGFALVSLGLLRAGLEPASRLAQGLAAASAVAGLGFAARHIWLVLHPGQLCGLDPLAAVINHWAVTQWMPWMFRADGLCADTPAVLGLALPFWSAAGFVVVFLLLLAAMRRRSRS